MSQRVFIEILAGPGVGESIELAGERNLIGRGSQCDLRLASPHVSRQQCEVIRQGDQLILENLGSVNVTYLNDRPIDRVYIQDGDLITFCDVALRVSLPRPGAAQADPDRTVAYQSGQLPPGTAPQPAAPQPAAPVPTGQVPQAQPPPPPPPPPASQGAPVAQAAPPPPPSAPITAPPGSHGAPQAVHPSAPPSARPPGLPPGMPPGAPPGMPPGRPPGVGGGPARGGPRRGPGKGQRRRKGKGPARPGSSQEINLPLIRNVAVGMAVAVVLIFVLGRVFGGSGPDSGPVAATTEQVPEKTPKAKRNGRTDQEIIQDAETAFSKGQVYLNQWQVSDDSLPEALSAFRSAKADLELVDKAQWPSFTRELDASLLDAEQKVAEEYSIIRVHYNHFQQMDDWQRAKDEMERVLILIPDPADERHQFARQKIQAIRAQMSGSGERHRWEDRR